MESTKCPYKDLLSLPPELLLPILQQLSHQSLCQVVLACRYLRQIGSDPDLWAAMVINKVKVRDEGIADLFKIPRFSKLKHLNLAAFDVEDGLHLTVEDLTEVLLYANTRATDGNSLESLDLTSARKLVNIPTELLSTGLLQVRKLTLSELTTPQINAIFEQMPRFDTLQELNLGVDLGGENCSEDRKANAQLLAEAICSLRKADLSSGSMNRDQCIALFSRSLTTDTLEELNLYNTRLEVVPSGLLNAAICRLRSVNLGYCLGYFMGTDLTQQTSDLQMTSLFTALTTSTTLQSIQFYNTDMSRIDPVILARGVCHVSSVELRYCSLELVHLNEIVRCKLSEEDNLKELDLSKNDFSDLSDCWQLAQAVARMRKVNLELTGLTSKQITVILRAIQKLSDEISTILEELYFSDSFNKDSLRKVPVELLLQKFVIIAALS